MEKYVDRPEILQKIVGKTIKDAKFNADDSPDALFVLFTDGTEISIDAYSYDSQADITVSQVN